MSGLHGNSVMSRSDIEVNVYFTNVYCITQSNKPKTAQPLISVDARAFVLGGGFSCSLLVMHGAVVEVICS